MPFPHKYFPRAEVPRGPTRLLNYCWCIFCLARSFVDTKCPTNGQANPTGAELAPFLSGICSLCLRVHQGTRYLSSDLFARGGEVMAWAVDWVNVHLFPHGSPVSEQNRIPTVWFTQDDPRHRCLSPPLAPHSHSTV